MTSNKVHKWRRDWLAWLLAGTALYALICLVSLAADVGRPFPGFFTYHNLILGRLDMVRNAPAWWWGVTDAEPTISDELIQVGDTPFTNLAAPINERVVYQQAWDAGQETIAIVVQRDGDLRTLSVPIVPFSWRHYVDFMFAPIVISATLWLLAWLLYRAAAADPTQRLAAILLNLMAILAIGLHPSLFQYDQPLDRFLAFSNFPTAMAGLALGVVFYQFALHFPYRLTSRLGKIGAWSLTALALLSFIAYVGVRIVIYTRGFTPLVRHLDQIFFYLWIGLILLGVLAILGRVTADSFFWRNQRRQRRETQILLLALLSMLPAVWLTGHYLGGSGQALSPLRLLADSRFFPLALPLAFAAISLRYHTFTGAQNWFFLALLLAGSGLLANVGTALLFWNRLALIRETAVPPTIIFFVMFCTVGLVWGWQSGWRGWLGRVFEWERISYHVVQNVGQRLLAASPFSETDVAQLIATTLCQELEVERTAVWLRASDHLAFVAQAGKWAATPASELPLLPGLSYQALRWDEINPVWRTLFSDQITAVLPLVSMKALLGVILIGPRWDTAVFDDRDLEILPLISQQATRFLHIAQQNNQLRQADQQILSALTHARQKTAQDLHDHLLPTLSRLQLDLLTVIQQGQEQPNPGHQTLARAQQDLAASTNLVRRIQQDLVSRPLEHGLHPYLVNMIQRFREETGIVVQQTLPPNLDTRINDIQLRESIYAIWQQALDNVQRHAQATRVTITLNLNEKEGTFEICDNGRGSSPEERQKAIRDGHFGLRSMQIRLESIGGRLRFRSSPDQGACVSGSFMY